jgi:glycosyltransferase involved in cell wall biosynthesis
MIIHVLPKYSSIGASSRYRIFQYLDAMQYAGITPILSALFDDRYLVKKYKVGKLSLASVGKGFFRRIWLIICVRSKGIFLIENELVPFFPAWLERFLKWRGYCLIFDYDDAIFHRYDQHSSRLVRVVFRRKIAEVMRLADLVVVGNRYLADYAYRSGAKNVKILPTVVDLRRYPIGIKRPDSASFVIGWIGSPSTAKYLVAIAPALAEISRLGDVKVRLIGVGPLELPGVSVEFISWTENTEVQELNKFDVGIMPLPDEPWARGKCGLKLIQYMACSLPVIASPVGVNSKLVTEGLNGLLAESDAEWVNALNTLRLDPVLRRAMGAAGRKRVEEEYSLAVTSPIYVSLLKGIHNSLNVDSG